MKTPANQVSASLNMYYEGMSIKAIRRHLQQEHDNAPSTATIYEWIMKYTQYAIDSVQDHKPKVGNTWVADETMIKLDGQNVWFWDIIDSKTRYLLASRISSTRTTKDAQILMDRAMKLAGKAPQNVITDKMRGYLDVRLGKDTEHKFGSPFNTEDNSNLIERFHGTLKARTKVMRGLKNLESAIEFTKGWLVHYNYLRPLESLDDKTPAEVAKVDYPYENWADITRHKPSKPIKITHVERGSVRMPETRVGRPGRKIGISKKPPKITPTLGRLE